MNQTRQSANLSLSPTEREAEFSPDTQDVLVTEQANPQLPLVRPGLLGSNVTHLKNLIALSASFPDPRGAMLRFMLLST